MSLHLGLGLRLGSAGGGGGDLGLLDGLLLEGESGWVQLEGEAGIVLLEDDGTTQPYSPEALALFAAMDVQPDNDRKTLINDTIIAFQETGLWDLHDVIHIRWAHTEQASNLNWKNPSGPFNSIGVNSPTFTVSEGVSGNGTNSYVNLNWAPTDGVNYTQNSATFWIWDNTPDAQTGSIAGSGTAAAVTLLPRNTTGNTLTFRINQSAAHNSGNIADGSGLSAGSRSGATAIQAYKNGVAVGTVGTAASTALSPVQLNLGRTNTSTFSTHQFGADGVAANLTAQQHADLYTILNTYRMGAPPFP